MLSASKKLVLVMVACSIQVVGKAEAEFGELPFQLVQVVVEGGVASSVEFVEG